MKASEAVHGQGELEQSSASSLTLNWKDDEDQQDRSEVFTHRMVDKAQVLEVGYQKLVIKVRN